MVYRKVITNLRKGRTVYAYVTATDPQKPGSFRLFLCTIASEEIEVRPEEQLSEKIRKYNTWDMLPLALFSLRWNIEISYNETKTFWSFRDYMVRSVTGMERLLTLICIAYATVKLLPCYYEEFRDYQGQSPQEIRYQPGEKIRMNMIIRRLGRAIRFSTIIAFSLTASSSFPSSALCLFLTSYLNSSMNLIMTRSFINIPLAILGKETKIAKPHNALIICPSSYKTPPPPAYLPWLPQSQAPQSLRG